MNYFRLKHTRRRQEGSALIVVIVAMLVLAVLGVAIYTLTSTATLNQVAAQRAARAFYLAESGVRIAASEYKAATVVEKNAVLCKLHNKEFMMPDNISRMTIKVYPYWFYSNALVSSGTSSLTLYLPGGLPLADDSGTEITIPSSGLLRVRDIRPTTTTVWSGITFVSYTSASVGTFDTTYGLPVTFSLSTAFSDDIVIGDEFYIGYVIEKDGSLSGKNLTLYVTDINRAKIFPSQKGTIFIVSSSISAFKYDLRIIDGTTSPISMTLTNIQNLDGTSVLPNILIGNQVYVGKSVGFGSTATYGKE